MAERPLLEIPKATRKARTKKPSARVNPNAKIFQPGPQGQSRRLAPRFDHLRQVIAQPAAQAAITLRADPNGIAPERAIVFEVAGSLADFYNQVGRVEGLEFLLEEDIDLPPDDNFYVIETKNGEQRRTEDPIGGRLYMAMPNLRALHEILRLWDIYRREEKMPRGFAPWKTLFDLLRNVRAWGPADRVLPETIDYWRTQTTSRPDDPVRFEVELWFHKQPGRRTAAVQGVANQIRALGGRVIHAAAIEPIRYHGMLVDLPPARVTELIEHPDINLARLDDIMYLLPQSVALTPNIEDPLIEGLATTDEQPAPQGLPVVALLDGVPLSNHEKLAGRIVLDDPEDFAANSPAASRQHGTAMASLILHGDIQAGEPALQRPLYVRPVMIYNAADRAETTPPDRLPLDVVYLAVRRLFAEIEGNPPAAPSVVVVNLSLGDINRPFTGRISPWARLIDWLSFQYKVLFLVSAGNVPRWLPVREFESLAEFDRASPEVREAAIIAAMDGDKASRSLLSPAEAINAITVGAYHADPFVREHMPGYLTDPFPNGRLPTINSAVGLGYRRTIKPDLLFDGGKSLVRASEEKGHIWLAAQGGGSYSGQMAATPDALATGRLNCLRRTIGTSNATALLARSAVKIYDSLLEDGHEIPRDFAAVVLKALLVHSATWGEAGDRLIEIFGSGGREWQQHRENISRFLGYGRPNVDRVLGCTKERATLFTYGEISLDTQDEFDIPLPPSIEGSTQSRRLTITLAWMTPLNPRHQRYRSATLEVMPNGDDAFSLAVSRDLTQPTQHAANRGTVFHCVFGGASAIAFLDNGLLRVRVTCRAQAGALDEQVPFALVISLETEIDSGIAVYDEVRAGIRAAVLARAAAST